MSNTSFNNSDNVPNPNVNYDEVHRQLNELADELAGWEVEVSQSPLTVPFIGLTNVENIDLLNPISALHVCILPMSESSFAVLPLQLQPTSVVATPNENKSTTVDISWETVPDPEMVTELSETSERTLEQAVERVRHICDRMD